MGISIDKSGNRYGRLIVLNKMKDKNKHGQSEYFCQCDCGNTTIIVSGSLSNSKKDMSCGCLRKENAINMGNNKLADLTGKTYNNLTALDYLGDRKWRCMCSCGNETTVHSNDLIAETVKSCGCKKAEYISLNSVIDLTGMKFGKLTVIKRSYLKKSERQAMWLSQCDCGNTHITSGKNLTSGLTCSCGCINSKGEMLTANYLNGQNIKFIQQYKFDDCRYYKPLRFDFAIFDNSDKLLFLCEFDGIQHFKSTIFRGMNKDKADENFKIIQRRDSIKNNYCIKNNIKLLRIPYTEINNINSIIENYIEELNIKLSEVS